MVDPLVSRAEKSKQRDTLKYSLLGTNTTQRSKRVIKMMKKGGIGIR